MHTCKRCLLNDNFPSVKIDEDELCNFCTEYTQGKLSSDNQDEEFKSLLNEYKDKRYQVILAYSGGKDSTYTLKMLKERYDISILALTFDNGFLSDTCFKNIRKITDNLGVDSVIVKYPESKMIKAFKHIEDGKAFPRQSLERASSICNLCIMLIKNLIYHEAIIRDIPIISFGWTPGQVGTAKPLIKLNYKMVIRGFDIIKNVITSSLGEEYKKYFLNYEFMEENEYRMPYLYYPFFGNDYNEENIIEEIGKIGWERPSNTDGNSSNCLLNSYANKLHIDNYGFHPYAFEISNLVRGGFLTREEGRKKLENVTNSGSYQMVCEKFKNA